MQTNFYKCPQCHVCSHECNTHEDYVYHMRKKHDFVPYVLNVCQVRPSTSVRYVLNVCQVRLQRLSGNNSPFPPQITALR